ncbi:MAG: hypothetical protein ABI678_09645 [Kofleriaceae bacterium]
MRTFTLSLLGASLLVACASSDSPSSPAGLDPASTTTSEQPATAATAPEHARWPGDIGVELVRGCADATCEVGALAIEVTSHRTDPVGVTIALSADGLDGRSAQVALETVTLAAGEQHRVAVDAARMPVQAVGSLATARAELTIDLAGTPVHSTSSPIMYEHAADWRMMTTYSVEAAFARAAQLEASTAPLVGRVWDGTRLVDLAQLPARGGAGFTLGTGSTLSGGVAPSPTGALPPPPQGNPPPPGTTAVCFDLKVQYNDAGVGEDYLDAGTGVQTQNATDMRAWITRTSGLFQITEWSGYLNSAGCSPYLTLAAATHVIHVQSSFEKPVDGSTAHHDVKLHGGLGDNLVTWTRSFAIASPAPSLVNVEALANDHTMSVAGVLARMYVGTDTWVPAGTNTTFVDKGCPNLNPPTDSCYNGSIYIGPGAQGFPADASEKFVIGHEHGHFVQGHRFTFNNFNYDVVSDSVGACRCDHVVSANQLHCIQSLEQYAAAFVEGFGHFYASKLYNNRLESDCEFGYYKEVYVLFAVLQPTVPVTCASTINWRDSHCTAIANSAVEMDVLRFLWALYSTLPDRLTMDEIGALLAAAQSHAGSSPITWNDLKAGAAQVFVSGSAKYNKVVSQAAIHAVD